jgi:hypothetical protein
MDKTDLFWLGYVILVVIMMLIYAGSGKGEE